MKHTLLALILAALVLASPAYAEAEASLMQESASVLIFNTVGMTANYTEDGETIQGASCSLASGGLWEDTEMSFNSQTGLFEFDSPMAGSLGEYSLTLTCAAENRTTEQDESSLWVVEPEGRLCGLEVDGLEAEGNTITGTVMNTGSWKQEVIYNIIINGQQVESWREVMEPGETADVEYTYSFGEGANNVRLEASSDCGSYDKEDTGHFVLVPYSCYSPYGIEGQEYCDYGSRTVKLCSAGQWMASAVEYCYACGSGICGDGVLNCGETRETCYRDWLAQERSEWESTHCSAKWLDDYRCDGDTLQREYRHSDCDMEWRDYEECAYGCDDGECNPVCGLSIESFDYNSAVPSNQMGHVTVSVMNTGEEEEEVDIILYVDGSRRSERTVELDEDERADRTIYYTESPGTHNIRVLAVSECGAAEDRYADVYFQERSTKKVQEPAPSAEGPAQDTRVTFGADSLDMEESSSRAIRIGITTSSPQDFTLSVTGVPSDWVSHEGSKRIVSSGSMYAYITAKEAGPRTIGLKVVADDEGKEFTHTLELYVSGSQEDVQDGQSSLDAITGNLISVTGSMTLTDSPVVAVMVAVIFFAALGVGLRHFRESEWDLLEAKYSANKHREPGQV